jgi:hypothetical protein
MYICASTTTETVSQQNKLTLEPSGRKIDYTYRRGRIHLTIPRLVIHDVIMVE